MEGRVAPPSATEAWGRVQWQKGPALAPNDNPSMRDAIEAALGEATPEGTGTPEAPVVTPQAPPAEGAQAEVAVELLAPEVEATLGAPSEGTADVPTMYFGEDLSTFDADQRAEIISMLEKRDDFIGKLLREKGQAPEGAEPAPVPEPELPVSDEDLLASLGLDVENNPFDEATAKVALPLAKGLQQMQSMVMELVEDREIAAIESQWNGALDALEGEYGELPVARIAVFEYAAANGINDPAAAYWTIAGPAKKQLVDAVKRAQANRPTPPTTTRPQARGAGSPAPLEATSTKNAVAEAARRVMTDLGLVQ